MSDLKLESSVHRAISHVLDAEIELEKGGLPQEVIERVADVRHWLYQFLEMSSRDNESIGNIE